MGAMKTRMIEDMVLRGMSAATIKTYTSAVYRFVVWTGRSPDACGTEEVRSYLIYLRTSGRSVSTCSGARAALRHLFTNTLARPDVTAQIPNMKAPHVIREVLTQTEVIAILAATRSRTYRAMFQTAYAAGLRVSELMALEVSHLDAAAGVIHIHGGKGGKDRLVMLSPRLLTWLREYWREVRPAGPRLFVARTGKPLCVRTVQKAFTVARERAGITRPASIHDLRHAFASHLLDHGVDLRRLQLLLGHARIETTAGYLHVSSTRIRYIPSPVDLPGLEEATPPW